MADRNKENNPNNPNNPDEELRQQTPGRQPQEDIRGQQKNPQDEPMETDNQPAKKGHQSGR